MLSTISYMLLVGAGIIMTAEGFFPMMYQPRSPGVSLGECKDCGKPLYLTPYIQEGRLAEARNKSRVEYSAFHGVQSYSGFLTVDAAHSSNTFFWYVPAQNHSETAPVILWLDGGPGGSSLTGLFNENGPFIYKNGSVERRTNYSWTENNNVIYIDNPVGTGFSWTKSGMAKNETVIGNNLYSALLQFFQLFPELQKNEFYATGESYAGKYVPAVCHAIHRENQNASQKINLKGFAICSGFSDPINQQTYSPYLYQIGLLDDNGRQQMAALEEAAVDKIKAEKWMDAYKLMDKVFGYEGTPSLFHNLTGYNNVHDYMLVDRDPHGGDFVKLFENPKLRKALHVGNLTYNGFSSDVFHNLFEDTMQSVAGWVAELLSHYRGVVYNGQLDIIVAYPPTVSYLKALNFSSAAEYKKAPRGQWRVGKYLAGYAKTAGNLTEVMVRDAGHCVGVKQPMAALDIIHRLTSNKPFF